MIVIFEGPRLVGKTTLVSRIEAQLQNWGLPAQAWKSARGEDPVDDMNLTLDEGIFAEDAIFLLDRFHLSEWVISKASRREAYPGSEWTFYEANLQKIDERLSGMKALVVLVTASPWMVEKRMEKLSKTDPIGSAQQAQYWWLNTIHKTQCDMIHIVNDRTNQLDRLVNMLSDFVSVRWARQKPSEVVAEIAKELGAEVKEVDNEDRVSPMGPGSVEPGAELSGGQSMDDESVEQPPF